MAPIWVPAALLAVELIEEAQLRNEIRSLFRGMKMTSWGCAQPENPITPHDSTLEVSSWVRTRIPIGTQVLELTLCVVVWAGGLELWELIMFCEFRKKTKSSNPVENEIVGNKENKFKNNND